MYGTCRHTEIASIHGVLVSRGLCSISLELWTLHKPIGFVGPWELWEDIKIKILTQKHILRIKFGALLVKLLSSEFVVRHKAITWADVESNPCRCMTSLDHNWLTHFRQGYFTGSEAVMRYINSSPETCILFTRIIWDCIKEVSMYA